MHFLQLSDKRYFTKVFAGPQIAQVSRWKPNGDPSIWCACVSPKVTRWLESNAKGRWYFVNNRLKTSIEEITISDEQKRAYRNRQAAGLDTEEERAKYRTSREIAFELKNDMLLFKLSYL